MRYLSSVQLKLSPSERASYAFRAQDVQPRFGFSQKNIQLKLPGPCFSCDICVLTSVGSSTSYSLCACSPDNKCMLVIQWLTHSIQEPIDSVHKSRVHTNAVCAFVVYMFQQRTSLNWELQLHLNQRPPLAYLGTVDSNSNTTSLCTSTVHLHDLVHHWILGISGSVRAGGNQCRCELRAEGLNGTNLVETESGQYIKKEDMTKDCSDCLLFKLYKMQQILRIHIPVYLLVSSLGIKNWLLWAPATLSKDVNFLSQKSSSGGLLLMARSTQSHLTDFAMRRKSCLELHPAFDVCIAAHSELLLSMGIQLGLSEWQPDDYNCFFYWLHSGYLFIIIVHVKGCGRRTSKLGMIWDPGGLLLVVPYPVSVSVQAPSPEISMACMR